MAVCEVSMAWLVGHVRNSQTGKQPINKAVCILLSELSLTIKGRVVSAQFNKRENNNSW